MQKQLPGWHSVDINSPSLPGWSFITLQWVEDWGFLVPQSSASLVCNLSATLDKGTGVIGGSGGLKAQVFPKFVCLYPVGQLRGELSLFLGKLLLCEGFASSCLGRLRKLWEFSAYRDKLVGSLSNANMRSGHLNRPSCSVFFSLQNLLWLLHFKEKLFWKKSDWTMESNLLRIFLHRLSYSILITCTSLLPNKIFKMDIIKPILWMKKWVSVE